MAGVIEREAQFAALVNWVDIARRYGVVEAERLAGPWNQWVNPLAARVTELEKEQAKLKELTEKFKNDYVDWNLNDHAGYDQLIEVSGGLYDALRELE